MFRHEAWGNGSVLQTLAFGVKPKLPDRVSGQRPMVRQLPDWINWSDREKPSSYEPVQLDAEKFPLPCSWVDWWSPRSWCCCTCFPLAHCLHGRGNPCLVQTVDALDPELYRKTLQLPTKCPNELRGVWWLQDNIAHETLVIFNDSFWEDVDEPGSGTMFFQHDLPQTWLRDLSMFGLILGIGNAWQSPCQNTWAQEWQSYVPMYFNFNEGKGVFKPTSWLFRVTEDEWQKPDYAAAPGLPGGDDLVYMYRWRRVMRGDGTTTSAWEEMKQVMESPLPHRNCFEPWCPCWPLCISPSERLVDMTYANRRQVVIFRPEERTASFSGCCCLPACPCPCLCPLFAKIDGAYKKNFPDTASAEKPPDQQRMLGGY